MIGGVELRKQRNLGDIVSDAFTILFAAWKPMAIICIPVVVASLALTLVQFAIDEDALSSDPLAERDPLANAVGYVALPISLFLFEFCAAAGVLFLDRLDRGNGIPPSEALDTAQERLGPLLGAWCRSLAIVVLLFITVIGIPFGFYRFVRWIFLSQVVILEGIEGEAVLARSAELVNGHWWNTLGRLLVTGLVIGIPVFALQQALLAAFPGVAGILTSSAIQFISAPFGIIATSLMYFDRYVRKAPVRHDDDALPSPA